MLEVIHSINIKRVHGTARRIVIEVSPQVYVGAILKLALGWPHRREDAGKVTIDNPKG